MTTMELEAYKMELIREIVEIDSREVLDAMKRGMKRAMKKININKNETQEDLTPYTMEEINSWIDEAEAEEEAGIEGSTLDEVVERMNSKYTWLSK